MDQIFDFIKDHPWLTAMIVVGVIAGLKFMTWLIRALYQIHQGKRLVFLHITLPRDDSPKDKEKETEKDFHEKISIMSQFFRNLHETRELNVWNTIKSRLLRHNIFSFELVAHKKILDFYITTPGYFKGIIEKQVTSYYPNAEVQEEKPYDFFPKGNKMKGFYAYEKRGFWFPIKTFKIVENDPLNDLTNIFTKMEEEETAVIQMVIRPRSNSWHKKAEKFGDAFFKGKKFSNMKIPVIGPIINVLKGIFLGYEKMEVEPKDFNTGYVRMLQPKEEIAKRIGEKATQPGFEVVLRLFTSAKTAQRTEEITNNMVIGLNLFQDPGANWFQSRRILPLNFINNAIFAFNFKYRLIDSRFLIFGEKKSILCTDELASIFHFPDSRYNHSPNINWLLYKALPAPVELPTEGILLGHNVFRGDKREVRFRREDRSRHHYMIGKSGTGKSSLLSHMVRQDIRNGEGVAVIDPHGDLIEDILPYIPKERVKDVIIFDPSDQERPMALNMLEAKDSAEMDLISVQATEIFIKLFGDEIFGPRIQHYFRNACLTLMEDPEEGATLIDIPRVFTDDAFLRYKVGKVKNPVVKSFWEHEYANTGDRERQEMIPYFSAKFGPFITNTIMRNTIGQQKSSFNLRRIMDEGKILLVKLSKGKIGDINTQLLGLVMVSKLQMAAMSRVDIPEDKRRDFFLYVDEFQSFATDSFCSILSEARKYHLNLIMAHQYINQLVVTKFGVTSTQIRDAVFGNVGTLSSFKVGAEDAEYLVKEYAPLLTEQDVIGISNYKMYTKLNINNTTSRPFSIATIWDPAGRNDKIAKLIKDYSRLKHARKREFVEQEITTRIGIDMDAPPVNIGNLPGQPNMAQPPEGNAMANILAQAQSAAAQPNQPITQDTKRTQ